MWLTWTPVLFFQGAPVVSSVMQFVGVTIVMAGSICLAQVGLGKGVSYWMYSTVVLLGCAALALVGELVAEALGREARALNSTVSAACMMGAAWCACQGMMRVVRRSGMRGPERMWRRAKKVLVLSGVCLWGPLVLMRAYGNEGPIIEERALIVRLVIGGVYMVLVVSPPLFMLLALQATVEAVPRIVFRCRKTDGGEFCG